MSDMAEAFFPCPKCNRNLKQSGTVDSDGQSLRCFQCDECTRTLDPFHDGKGVEVALTFCVDPAGRVVDPSSPDEILRW